MKIIITAVDQAKALNNFIQNVYGLDVLISYKDLSDMTVEIDPIVNTEPKVKEEVVSEEVALDTERKAAEERAEELGISFRSDIKTENLISRIEEEEERIAKLARTPDPLPMDEGVEEYEDEQEEEEEQQDTKPSIFNITKTAEEDSTEEQEDKPRSNFFDKIKKKEA